MNRPETDYMELEIQCVFSNIGDEWIATGLLAGREAFVGKGRTRPEALRELADDLEDEATIHNPGAAQRKDG